MPQALTPNDLWQAALGELELKMTRGTFNTWLKSTHGLTLDEDTLVIGVPNDYAKDWIEKRLRPAVTETVERIAGTHVDCAFVVRSTSASERPAMTQAPLFSQGGGSSASSSRPTPQTPPQAPQLRLNRRYTFDTFVVGAGNRLAHAAAQAVAENAGARYNPLFIYGGVGLGKTHLLHAIAAAALERGMDVRLVSTEQFMNDLINAIRGHSTESFRSIYRDADMLLMDDIQFIGGKEGTQEEFFHTFNSIYGSDGQIVLTSDRPPQAIATLEERLRSRFQWGLQVDIEPPDLETRIAILREKSERTGPLVPPPVLELIAQTVQQNVRELEGALNRVVAYAQCNRLPLNTETARRALADLMIRRDPPSLQKVLDTVADYYQLEADDLTGRSRAARISEPRQVAMYLMREESEASYPSIGTVLGGRDHTTILHGCDKITRLMEQDAKLRRDIIQVRERLYGR
jgi:chromosomal replication initiator protein